MKKTILILFLLNFGIALFGQYETPKLVPDTRMRIGFEVDSFGELKWHNAIYSKYWVEERKGYAIFGGEGFFFVHDSFDCDSVLLRGRTIQLWKNRKVGLLAAIPKRQEKLLLQLAYDSLIIAKEEILSYCCGGEDNFMRSYKSSLLFTHKKRSVGLFDWESKDWLISPLPKARFMLRYTFFKDSCNNVVMSGHFKRQYRNDSLKILRKELEGQFALVPYDTICLIDSFVIIDLRSKFYLQSAYHKIGQGVYNLSKGDTIIPVKRGQLISFDLNSKSFVVKYFSELFQVYDTLGNKKTGVFKSTYLKQFSPTAIEFKDTFGKYGIYNITNWELQLPFVFTYTRRLNDDVQYLFKDGLWFVFDHTNSRFLKDSFNGLYQCLADDRLVGRRNKDVVVLQLKTLKEKVYKNCRYLGCRDSLILLKKKSNCLLINLKTNQKYKLKYDSAAFVGVEKDWCYSCKNTTNVALIAVFKDKRVGLINAQKKKVLPVEFKSYSDVNELFVNSREYVDSNRLMLFYRDDKYKKNVLLSTYRGKILAKNISYDNNYGRYSLYSSRNGSHIIYKSYDKYGVTLLPDSVIMKPVIDSVVQGNLYMVGNKYYYLDYKNLPFSKDQLYDSFSYGLPRVLFLYNKKKTTLVLNKDYPNSAQLYSAKNGFEIINKTKYGYNPFYSYSENGKKRLIFLGLEHNLEYDDVKSCHSNLVWVKQNGKWGLLEYYYRKE